MKSVFIIAKNTFREIIRDRILYGLVVFSILLIAISMILGLLSFAEQIRISMNFGLAAIHIGAVVLSVFVGSTLVNKEIDKKTIMTLLVRPLSRSQFIFGKALGLILVNLTSIGGLAIVLATILLGLGGTLSTSFFVSIYGILLESMVLLAVALFFSTFSSSFMVVAFSMAVFLIGHWIESLRFFAEKSESTGFIFFQRVIDFILPNLEVVNWRTHAVYADSIPLQEIAWASMYTLIWCGILVAGNMMIFGRKDFA